jgi:D-3-phosphoglycerate dehydrogenase
VSGSPLVVITDSDLPSNQVEETLLIHAGLRVRREQCRTEDDVVMHCADADALIVQWATIGERALAGLPGLRFISRVGIGYDMIDVQAATRRGVLVANTPDYCIEEVAAHSLALILDRARGVIAYDRAVREGAWTAVATYPHAMRPSASTVAVVGYGRIGRRVSRALTAVGFNLVVHDPFAEEHIAADGYEPLPLHDALRRADIVTLHASLTAGSRHLIDADALAAMPPGAQLVNTCRGGLIDETALVDALLTGRLSGAALDVFEQEPLSADSALRTIPTVTLTPHAAWYSPAALADLPVNATRQVIDFFAGRPIAAVLNPSAAAPAP